MGCLCMMLCDQSPRRAQLGRESHLHIWWLLFLYLIEGENGMDVRLNR